MKVLRKVTPCYRLNFMKALIAGKNGFSKELPENDLRKKNIYYFIAEYWIRFKNITCMVTVVYMQNKVKFTSFSVKLFNILQIIFYKSRAGT